MIDVKGKVSLDGRGWEAGLRQIDSSTTKLAGRMGGELKGQIAALFSVAAFTAASKSLIDYGSRINDLATRAGVSTDAIQELGYAAKQNGSDMETMVGFLEKVGEARAKALGGDTEKLGNFEKLGVSKDDLKNKRSEEIASTIGGTVKGGDVQNLISSLRDVGGKSAGALVAAFKDGLEEKAQEARDAGLVMGAATIKQLDTLGDHLDTLGISLKVGLAPVLLTLVDSFQLFIDTIREAGAYWGAFVGTIDFKRFFKELFLNFVSGGVVGNTSDLTDQLKAADKAGINEGKKVREENDQRRAAQMRKDAEDNINIGPIEEPKPKEEKVQKEKKPEILTDSLLKVGNFLGSSGRNSLEALGQKQYEEAKKQTYILGRIEDKLGDWNSSSLNENVS